MQKSLSIAAAAALAVLCSSAPAGAPETPLESGAAAWDRGDYLAALTTYLQVLESADPADAIEPIALQTGELFHSRELTNDGAQPRFSPDGRHITYEVGTGFSRVTRVLPTADPSKAALELPGHGAAFSSDGAKIVYLKVNATAELREAEAAVASASQAERGQRLAVLNRLLGAATSVVVIDVASRRETTIDAGSMRKSSPVIGVGAVVLFSGASDGPAQIFSAAEGRTATALTSGDGEKAPIEMNADGSALLYSIRTGGGGRGGGGGGQAAGQFGILTIADGRTTVVSGSAPSFAGDGKTLTYVARQPAGFNLMVAPVNAPGSPLVVRGGPERLDAPALSHDGSRVAFQMMPKEDWEIYVVNRDGRGELRLTREIQHDLAPRFLTSDRILAVMGEPRHRRSYLYELPSGKRTRLFHNNTVRTIAPEYAWEADPAGTKILISAERDGDTVSPERGIYLMDLSRRVTRDDLRARVKANLDAERALRAKAEKLYAAIAPSVRQAVAEASVGRVYAYEKALFDFDSKHITRPGNKLAAEYLFKMYKSFGYEPQYQWFDARNAAGGQTANVLATLKGTVNPELVYVVSSHYDSTAAGPGADDDSSGTAALLEAARILASRPQPATIVFASFTGEEAGLLGSREFVRRAVADKVKIVGALNNDMIGWANDHRLDNTIRYSNPGIRDIQHAAALQFTDMITYDALYYKGTDAAAYYEAFGDIVGGIGSYPVLGNPHYHQSHDLLETINHQLVTEVAKTTAATLMLLAASPSRTTGLSVERFSNGTATLSWTPAPESGVTGYIVAYGKAPNPEAQQVRVTKPGVTLQGVSEGTLVSVKAVNAKGFEGWDWARVTIK